MEKINTDNLLRDNFEMFMVSQLHNAFRVVVQFERHCWLSLAAGIFCIILSDAARTQRFWKHCKTLPISAPPQTPPPPNPSPARAGPDCWKAAQTVWPPSKPGHFGNRHTQVLALSVSGVMGSPLWPGVDKHTWPKTNFHNSARCANRRPQKYPEKSDHAKTI